MSQLKSLLSALLPMPMPARSCPPAQCRQPVNGLCMQSLESFQRTGDLYLCLSSHTSAMALLSDPGMPNWSTGSQPQAAPEHSELKQCNVTWLMSTYYSHQYLIKIQIFQSSQTHTALGKQQAGIFMFDSLLCSMIRCHQPPQQLLGILVSNSTMEL